MRASFRDPSGTVFSHAGRIFRAIRDRGLEDFNRAEESGTIRKFVENGSIVNVRKLDDAETAVLFEEIAGNNAVDLGDCSTLVEHEKLSFPTFPYEWSPEMLYRAAILTLDIAEALSADGMGLKDATPYNVLFRGPEPVFVDWLSFEKRDELDPYWLPQAQFVRTFIIPLLMNKKAGLSLAEAFISNRDGIEPEKAYEMISGVRKFASPFLSVVTLPRLLGSKRTTDQSIYEKRLSDSPDKARFILERQFAHLRRLLIKVKPDEKQTSNWSDYLGPNQHFSERYLKHKDDLVSSFLEDLSPGNVLDVGSNTGYFSRIAAKKGASVVSLDQDAVSVDGVWRMAAAEELDILPLIIDITRPSPGTGWRNQENPSFLSRTAGGFDVVLMLAVIHHMMVTERVPLNEILQLFSEIATGSLIIEYVPPDDPMFRTIARGRDNLFEYFTRDFFENACSSYFRIRRNEQLADSNRRLYLLTHE